MNYKSLKKHLSFKWQIKILSIVYQRILFKIEERKVIKALPTLLDIVKGDTRNYQNILNRRLKNIMKYAASYSPYYADKIPDKIKNAIVDLAKVPILDKEIIRANFNQIISIKIKYQEYYVMNTGGSTGEPLEFFASPHFTNSHHQFLFRQLGYKKGDKIFSMGGLKIPEELVKRNLFWLKRPYIGIRESYHMSSSYLTNKNLPDYVNFFVKQRPDFLRGYPSFIYSMAQYFLTNNLSVDHVKGVILTAEQVFDWQIETINRAFNAKIILEYGHSEVSVFAFTIDESYKYYCSPFYGFTEILDKTGKHVQIGEKGEIVVTGFRNKCFPFIRYRTGDVAEYGGNVGGVIILNKIFGRTQDFIVTKQNDKISLTAIIFGQHYTAFKNIKKWQLIQHEPGALVIKIVKDQSFSDSDEREIREKFQNFKINFNYVNHIPPTSRGKTLFLIQNLDI